MINQVMIIGRLGRDPEVKFLTSGSAVASFTVATDESYTKNGQKVEKTEWHKVVAYGKLAEICGEYLTKGKLVFVQGKLQTREWEGKDGKRQTTEIMANTMKMLEKSGGQKPEKAQASGPAFDDEDVPF